jgi:integrase
MCTNEDIQLNIKTIDNKLLQNLLDNGILDEDTIQVISDKMNALEKKNILMNHPYAIAQNKDGLWRTKVKDLSKANGRKEIKRKTKEELEDALIEHYKSIIERPTVEMIFNKYMDERLELYDLKKQSADRYRSDFNRFFYNPNCYLADVEIKSIDEAKINEFFNISIRDFKLTSKTFSGLKTIVQGIFRYAKLHKYTDLSITYVIGDYRPRTNVLKSNKKVKSHEEEIFTNEEYAKVHAELNKNPDVKNMGLMIMYDSGLRIGELSALKKTDFSIRYAQDGN